MECLNLLIYKKKRDVFLKPGSDGYGDGDRRTDGDTHLGGVAGGTFVVGRHGHGEVATEVVSGVLELVIARLDTGR